MPCFGRPQRTIRAIESILSQTINNWEAFIIGDCCPDFQRVLDANNKESITWRERAHASGNEIRMFNSKKHEDGYGYAYRNYANEFNNAEFMMYLDNDDMLEPNHFENYLSEIDGTGYDLVYFNTKLQYLQNYHQQTGFINPIADRNFFIRNTQMLEGKIGHAELIIRSKFLKDHPEIQETPEYGHDWKFIQQMISAGVKHKHAYVQCPATYLIMGAGELRETDID